MPITLGVVQLAFFGYGAFRLATLFYRWLVEPRESVTRLLEEQRADPPGAAEREGARTGLLVPAALAAWLWADLNVIWLLVAVLLALSALSSFLSARNLRQSPALLEARRTSLGTVNIEQLTARGLRVGATAAGVGLTLWLYSWSGPLLELWQSLSTSAAL